MDNRDLAAKILHLMLEKGPEKITAISHAIDLKDCPAACQESHALKGMALNTACPALAEVAGKMETAAREADHSSLARLLPEVKNQFRLVADSLKKTAL